MFTTKKKKREKWRIFFWFSERKRTSFSKVRKKSHENQYMREREKMAKVKKK